MARKSTLPVTQKPVDLEIESTSQQFVNKARGLILGLEEPGGLGLAGASWVLCVYTFVKSQQ